MESDDNITTKSSNNQEKFLERIEYLEQKVQNQELIIEHLSQYNRELEEFIHKNIKEINYKVNEFINNLKTNSEFKREINIKYFNIPSHLHKLLQLNDALIETETRLYKTNTAKDKFISIITHDLMNPLQTLILGSAILAKKAHQYTTEQIVQECKDINFTVVQLSDLLNNLLQWSKSRNPRIEYNPEYIDLDEIIDEVFKLFSVYSKRKKIELIKELSRPHFPYADKKMLRTILRNLVSNAIKFTEIDGKVVINAKYSKGFTEISIKDTGIGIPRQAIKKIFNLEKHYSTPGTDNEKGTGFGLILCKEFVRMNGGTIKIDSILNKGTTICFTLPVKPIN